MPAPSALTNTYSSPGIITKENFADFLETNFSKVNEDLMTTKTVVSQIFPEETTNLDHVKHTSLVGLGTMPLSRDEQELPRDTPIQGFDNTITPETRRLSIWFPESMRETAQYGLMSKMQRMLMQSARDTEEYQGAIAFNSTFGSSVPFLAADGLALVDTSRNLENGSGTWTNQETAAALTQNSLETMDNNFAATVNGRGLRRPLRMAGLIVPRALRRKALELTQSDKRPEDNLNAGNIFKGAFDVIVWDHLTSSTAWFGYVDMKSSEYQLGRMWGAKPSVLTQKHGTNPDVTLQRIRMKFADYVDRAHGIRGNAGA